MKPAPWTDDEVAALVRALPVEPPPATFRVSLLALKAGMCKWPVADAPDLTGGFEFCGRHAHQGAVYCDRHRRLATNVPKRWAA